MNILLLGGTGAMGISLCEILNEQGHTIYVTSRSHHADYGNVHYIIGNAKNDDFLAEILRKHTVDVLVDFMVYTTDQFKKRLDLLLSGIKQYIFFSSSRVYNESAEPIKESSLRLLDSTKDKEYLQTDEYALAKAREEDVLTNSKYKNWTIIRPYITYNVNRLQLGVLEKEDWLYRALQGRKIVFSKAVSEHYTTLTYGYNVAQGIASTLGKDEAMGQKFHIVALKPMKWKDVLALYVDVIEQMTGKRPEVYLHEDMNMACKVYGNYYQVHYDRLFDRVFDSEKICRLNPALEFTSMQEGLKKCLTGFIDAYKEKNVFLPINWRNEAYRDRLTGEHSSFSEMKGWRNKLKYVLYRYTWFMQYKCRG